MKKLLFLFFFFRSTQVINSPCTINGLVGTIPEEVCVLHNFMQTFKKNNHQDLTAKLIVMHGEVGIGKTTAIRAMAQESGAILKEVAFSEAQFEESADEIKALYEEMENLSANTDKPIIILLEDIDLYDNNVQKNITEVAALASTHLASVKNIKNERITTIITHNAKYLYLKEYQKSLYHCILWEQPNLENRKALIAFFCQKYAAPLNEKTINALAHQTDGHTARTLEKIFIKAELIRRKENTQSITIDLIQKAFNED